MGERPVTVRTLDPPLHEFLPHDDLDTRETATALGIAADVVKAKVDDLHESNPMLGHRGCRLGIAYPEITAMQVRAILEAACLVAEGRPGGAPRDHDPAGRHEEGARAPGRRSCARSRRRSSPSKA